MSDDPDVLFRPAFNASMPALVSGDWFNNPDCLEALPIVDHTCQTPGPTPHAPHASAKPAASVVPFSTGATRWPSPHRGHSDL